MDDETLPTGQTAIPADRIDDLGIHTFAHCMWWVDKGEDLPTDPLQRNRFLNYSSHWIIFSNIFQPNQFFYFFFSNNLSSFYSLKLKLFQFPNFPTQTISFKYAFRTSKTSLFFSGGFS